MSKNHPIPDFTTFTRDLTGYKWYKPVLTIILSVVFYIILITVLGLIMERTFGLNSLTLTSVQYESVNTTSIEGIFDFLYLVAIIPSIYFASLITKDRPFSTYLTSRGKWNWDIFLKSFIISAIFVIIFTILPELTPGAKINITFTIVTFILAIIIVPLQCFAEELSIRGLFMQSFGAWFKIPVLAIILQAILFTILHPYNLTGQITVLAFGIISGVIAWKMNGLEISTGMHVANNLLVMLSMGIFSIPPIATNVTIFQALTVILMDILNAAALFYLSQNTNWLNVE